MSDSLCINGRDIHTLKFRDQRIEPICKNISCKQAMSDGLIDIRARGHAEFGTVFNRDSRLQNKAIRLWVWVYTTKRIFNTMG